MDDLGQRIRDADPYAGKPLPDSALNTLDEILSGRRRPRNISIDPRAYRTRGVPIASLAGGLVAVATMLTVVVFMVLRPQVATAMTPDPLELEPTISTASTLREEIMRAVAAPSGEDSLPGAAWEGWYYQVDAENAVPGIIQPQVTRLNWNSDFSGMTEVIAGVPTGVDGVPLDPIPDTVAQPGTTISSEVWNSGELVVPFPEEPPTTEDAMRTYLAAYLQEGGVIAPPYTAGDYLSALVTLAQVWTLNANAQRAAILVILDAPGVSVIGTTVDRAGRAGIVLGIDPTDLDPTHRDLFVISANAWTLLASERIYIGGAPDLPLDPGSVTEYTIWR